MQRRDFIKQGLAAAGGASLLGTDGGRTPSALGMARVASAAQTNAAGGHYAPNRAPLQPTALLKLPTGSITPRGWLRQQLELDAEGLCGRMPEVSDYLVYEGNGWVDARSDTGWEEVPYWLRGFGDLGYVLGDTRITALALKWINGILTSQSADGWFGPPRLRTSLDGGPDMWPHMPLLNALQSYHEYTQDARVLPFLTRYFAFQETVPAAQFAKSWAGVRWGDTLETLFWLYNRTGQASLLDLAKKIHAHSADYVNGIPTWHNVNLAQGFREPAEYGLLSRDPCHLAATVRNYETLMDKYGQMPGGGFAGDENCRPGYGDPRQGFETCGIVEFMHSFQMLTRMTGDPVWADRCEELAFNSLPAALDAAHKGTHYITSANSVQLDNLPKGRDFANDWPMQAYMPGVHNYRCCPHNYGMGWAYYAQELWLATADNGLCASLYAASTVKAKVGSGAGTPVAITQETEYPFGDTVHLTVQAPHTVRFPLHLRIPRWCESPTVRINGKPVSVQAGPSSFVVLERAWKNGDTVTLHLPMQTAVRVWEKNSNSVSVSHGPLTFALTPSEQWHQIGGTARWPEYEVLPRSTWNYGLALNAARPGTSFDVLRKAIPPGTNPWTLEGAPVELRARARKIAAWTADSHHVVRPLQPSPARTDAPLETITLIPMGAARLRIAAFPTVDTGPSAHEWTQPQADVQASFVCPSDTTDALQNRVPPLSSHDDGLPRFTWWSHKGTTEWVSYTYAQPTALSSAAVFWYDDGGGCRVPQSWRLLYQDGGEWKPVQTTSVYGTRLDQYNAVAFAPVITTALKLEAQLQPGASAGVLQWRVDKAAASAAV